MAPESQYPLFEAILTEVDHLLRLISGSRCLIRSLSQPLTVEDLVDLFADCIAAVWRFADSQIRKKKCRYLHQEASESESDDHDDIEEAPLVLDRSRGNQLPARPHKRSISSHQNFSLMFMNQTMKTEEQLEKWIKAKLSKLNRLQDDEVF